MNKTIRILIAMALVGGIAVLARNKIAWAGSGLASPADQSTLATLTGFIWDDTDQDGLQDVGERGVPNVVVNLFDASGTPVNTAISDGTGRYQFAGLAPGEYYVGLEGPAGFAISPNDEGEDEALDSDADMLTGETVPAALTAGENTLKWDIGLYRSGPPAFRDPGSVQPPPGDLTVCENGIRSVGGVATLEVNNLAPGYCLVAFLRNNAFALGRIPDGAGTVLAPITFLRIFHHGRLVYELPTADGQVEICFAVPPGKTAQIYFFNFYGPRFGERSGQPSWEALETTVDGGMACAAAQTTGAYALIGQ